MERKRFEHIDLLRAVAIIGVMATHVFASHRSAEWSAHVWNYLHFAVGMFVFSSGYVLAEHYRTKLNAHTDILSWYKKRLSRLLFPLYIYLAVHYSLMFLLPWFFDGYLLKESFDYILRSVLLVKGFDPNWLPLLFIQLTILFPVFVRMTKKNLKRYVLFAVLVTTYFTLFGFPYDYSRLVMWIPWSLIFLAGIYVQKKENNSEQLLKFEGFYFKGLIFGGIAFVVLTFVMIAQSRTLIFTSHKYPPDFYYLSFTTMVSALMLMISALPLFKNKTLQKSIHFVSNASYSLFFIHYVVIDFMLTTFKNVAIFSNVWVQLIFVVATSLLIGGFIRKYNAKKKV